MLLHRETSPGSTQPLARPRLAQCQVAQGRLGWHFPGWLCVLAIRTCDGDLNRQRIFLWQGKLFTGFDWEIYLRKRFLRKSFCVIFWMFCVSENFFKICFQKVIVYLDCFSHLVAKLWFLIQVNSKINREIIILHLFQLTSCALDSLILCFSPF